MPSTDSPPIANNRAELRRKAFLQAARQVFLEQGYEAANMSEIVRRAGGSLTTLYNQFGDKKGIFLAMLDESLSEITHAMEVESQTHAPVREGLNRIGIQFVSQLTRPDSLETYRLIVGLARQFPDVAKSFSEKGPDKVRVALAAYLRDREEAGEINAENPTQLASLFLDMVRMGLQSRALLDSDFRPTQEEVESTVRRAVDIFLNGVAPHPV
ncbi:MAG: TetR/AcrR family transcriptional regulator [Alphaproteobacteria bacterium]|nr:hypothetical protein [Hyphomonas sp.]MBR9806961.1 TetR/AcrR family transcriptional regulator [Alphaproteobacteria bacterium]|tara:strand:- start:2936 stop:3574 length:639 start_codon:yes stop_codon:yes gene_type:complete